MKCVLVFDDWRQYGTGVSIYSTELGISLSAGDLHSGSTFDAELGIPAELEAEMQDAYRKYGAYPVFAVIPYGGCD